MQVSDYEIEAVEAQLNKQNGLKAVFAVAFWCVPILVLWYYSYQVNDKFAPVMLAVSGAMIGLVVRYVGRGYNFSFSLIAFLAHLMVVLAALLMGLVLGQGQVILAFILVGLYILGAWLAVYLGRISVPFEQHKAFYVLTEKTVHPSNTRIKNQWFLTAPLTLVLCCILLYITMVALVAFDISRVESHQASVQQKQQETLQDKGIDVTTASLASLTDEQAMRHAYAYFKGYIPSKNQRSFRDYPYSEYKSKRILTFLAEERNHSRAKFVLGLLNYDKHGIRLIQEAADEGDIYAKIHVATEFGCYGNTQRAIDSLKLLARVTQDKSVKNEIDFILKSDFEDLCAKFSEADFSLKYTYE